jgi:hypothetical protein
MSSSNKSVIHLESFSPAEQFLCCACSADQDWQRQELGPRLNAVGEPALLAAAADNEMIPTVAQALKEVGITPGNQRWEEERTRQEKRIGDYMATLDLLADRLLGQSIRLVVLKNAGLARAYCHHRLAACPMSDVDLLVDKLDYPRVHMEILALGGWLLGNRSVGAIHLKSMVEQRRALVRSEAEKAEELQGCLDAGGGEFMLELPGRERVWIEIQCRTVGGYLFSNRSEPRAGDFISRAVPIEGSNLLILAPHDNLLQVCMHTARHSYLRPPGFRLHTDVDRIVRHGGDIDWQAFIAEARARKAAFAVYFSLRIPFELLRTPVPGWVLEELRPPPWKERLLSGQLLDVGLFGFGWKRWDRPRFLFFNVALQDDWPTSIITLSRILWYRRVA